MFTKKLDAWQSAYAADLTVFEPEDSTHPEYDAMQGKWDKYRYTFEGGSDFIGKYLKKFSTRENTTDFNNRKEISYSPSHAKSAVIDIKNSIYQRMIDITRVGGTPTYMSAIRGENLGVDLDGNTINGFIGRLVLPELLSMGKVGVFIDRPILPENPSLLDTQKKQPYLYMYKTEDIRNWSVDKHNQLTSLLLRDYTYVYDDQTGLPVKETINYRLLKLTPAGNVGVTFYNSEGETHGNEIVLNLTRIPFVIFEINSSLLTDVADYQVALLNLASSDMNYALKSNFPFYTEQYDIRSEMAQLLAANSIKDSDGNDVDKPGTSSEAGKAKNYNTNVGVAQGRRYPANLERPAFIHPSSEPLLASMKKQGELRQEIRQLVNLAVSDIEPRHVSADSKKEDSKSLESGLSYIGLELEYGERQIGEIWSMYEKSKLVPTIKYPENYSLKDDETRRLEAKQARELIPVLPSLTYQKFMAKQIARLLVGHKVSNSEFDIIMKEIDDSLIVVTDPDVIIKDFEAGFLGTELASQSRGYPKGQVEIAKKDHAERAARIVLAQTKAADMKARGAEDLGVEEDAGKREKDDSRGTSLDVDIKDKTRGKGR